MIEEKHLELELKLIESKILRLKVEKLEIQQEFIKKASPYAVIRAKEMGLFE